jgi:hypothetical protein
MPAQPFAARGRRKIGDGQANGWNQVLVELSLTNKPNGN